jgi:hypothetical protein
MLERGCHAGENGQLPRLSRGDLELSDVSLEDLSGLIVTGARATEGFDISHGLPALEDVDTTGVHQIRRQGEVQTSPGGSRLTDHLVTALEVRRSMIGIDPKVTGNDDHVTSRS